MKLGKDNEELREENRKLIEDMSSLETEQTAMKQLVSHVSGLTGIYKSCQACRRRCNQQGLVHILSEHL